MAIAWKWITKSKDINVIKNDLWEYTLEKNKIKYRIFIKVPLCNCRHFLYKSRCCSHIFYILFYLMGKDHLKIPSEDLKRYIYL